ncbi:pericentrin-like [Talpa occidentalis]|uniref:pericentrin-like n=1 Tax=Talpa occidentalis TaxID=50954 RepID=UPI0023FA417E|nr:pericentrin-like [Talpa occidentalis]
MEEDEQEQRRRKVEAGRAKLAHFRQRRTKGDGARPKKAAATRKGTAVAAPVPEESPLAGSAGDAPGAPGAVQPECPDGQRPEDASSLEPKLGVECREQPGDPPKERALERELAKPGGPHEGQPGGQGPVAELEQLQTQPPPGLELEALRLSLHDAHAAHLELAQAALQREKEAALVELRASLNGRHAQELALAQGRQRRELELVREQHAREREELVQRWGQETAELKEKLQLEVEKNVRMMETLRQDWVSERDLSLESLRRELSARHQEELGRLRDQLRKESVEQKAELEKALQAKTQAERALQTLQAQQEAMPQELRADLQTEHHQHVQELEFTEQEQWREESLTPVIVLPECSPCQPAASASFLEAQQEPASPESGPELTRACPRHAQDQASKVQAEVASRALDLEAERKAALLLEEEISLLKKENRNLREERQWDSRLGEDAERVRHDLVKKHQEELKKAEEQIQVMKQDLKEKEAEWRGVREALQRSAEETLARALLELSERTESEKQSLASEFECREREMRQLQAQQAAQILELEASLAEQQGRLRQLEQGLAAEEAAPCSQCGQELAMRCPKEDCTLQLTPAPDRFLEERKETTGKFSAEQDARLQEAQERHEAELQRLREEHRQHMLALTAELEARHQAQAAELRAALESEQRALVDARAAGLQAQHVAEVSALRTQHAAGLDTLGSRHLGEVQDLALLCMDLEGQTHGRGPALLSVLPQDPESSLPTDPQGAFESGRGPARPEREGPGSPEGKKALSLQPREDGRVQQLEDQVCALRREAEAGRSELETLQRRRDRENQEGARLLALLQADLGLAHGERRALREALRRLLGLFGETVKAAAALKTRIGERVGLCLDAESPPGVRPGDEGPCAGPGPDETWPGLEATLLELDKTLPECTEVSSEAEMSSHIRDSFLLSPESTQGYEQPIRGLYRSLGLAVDGLLEMALGSTRQLEEARQIHSQLEKAFSCKNEETAQVVRQHRELLERLDAEATNRTRLALELHKAEGVIEGFREEQCSLQAALGRKEASEQGLVLELERLRQQLQRAAQQQAELQDQKAVLCSQKQETEATLQREVQRLTREQAETRQQAEKDRLALRSQMQVLESELEEQLARQQACAREAEELPGLRQQLQSLDKHLRNQRQFMDEQAAEREHEREEFQQEIRRLEEQLRLAARPPPSGAQDSEWPQRDKEVESLQEKLREKSDGLNELAIQKELVERRVSAQEEEIRRLEEADACSRRALAGLQEELEAQRRALRALQQEKEALQDQPGSRLLLLSASQPPPNESRRPGYCPKDPEGQLEAMRRALLQRESEILDLKEQLENAQGDLVRRSEEVVRQGAQLDGHSPAAYPGEPCAEPGPLQAKRCRSSEMEELKSVIESLQENQARLQRDKAKEVEQLHEVIERLQWELSLGAPVAREASGGCPESLQRELDSELQAALAAKEALGQLLAERERGHSQALEALQQRLREAEEVAAQRLAELEQSTALREAEVQGLATQVREFEATLRAKEVTIAERDSEIAALSRRKSAHLGQLEAISSAVGRLRLALEQPPAAGEEAPELQRLRAQCACLGRQLQRLSQRILTCQQEPGKPPAPQAGAHPGMEGSTQGWGPRAEEELEPEMGWAPPKTPPGGDLQGPARGGPWLASAPGLPSDASLGAQDSVMSVLGVCERQLEAELLLLKSQMLAGAEGRTQAQEELPGDHRPQAVGLITQVDQLQERLSRLVCSMNRQDFQAEDPAFQQPLALSHVSENSSSSGGSGSPEEAEDSPPADALTVEKTAWRLGGVPGDQGPGAQGAWPSVPGAEGSAWWGEPLPPLAPWHGSPQGSPPQAHAWGAEPLQNGARAMDRSSWGSPELVRKDSTLEPPPSLPLTPCSGAPSPRSLDTPLRAGAGTSLLQADQSGLLWDPGVLAVEKAPWWAESWSAADRLQRTCVEKDVEDFITSLDSQEKSASPAPGVEGKSSGSEKSDGAASGEVVSPGSGSPDAPPACLAAAPLSSARSRRPLGMVREQDLHPKQVKTLLQMVCDESHHILALSQYWGPPSALSKGEPSAPLEHLLRRGQSLLEAVPALRGHLSPAPLKGEQEPAALGLNWRAEFLQAVREAFEEERELIQVQLQHPLGGPDPRGPGCLLEQLERVVCEQGALQEKSLERPHQADRSSLLSEVQALRAQLRMTHLQNQEKLQQLCAALTSAEARGSRQEHQLRRQVELLAYKVEQEKSIASDLQRTLSEEQEAASHARKLLVAEQAAARALGTELRQCRQENERLLRSLDDVRKEVLRLRSLLDGQEKDLKAALQELESERGRGSTLQSRLEEQQQQLVQREAQSASALEALRASLDKQRAQSSRLRVALKHEQAARDNLQRELRIEASRCEALLAQERSRLAELQQSLEAERGRVRELTAALQHERLLTEQLSRRAQEAPPASEAQPPGPPPPPWMLGTEQVQTRPEELQREEERELELRRQREEHKAKQLQQPARELEAARPCPQPSGLHQQQRGLEETRQQLLCVAGLLTSFVSRTVDRTLHDWTSSNEKAVASLLRTLQELRAELSASSPSQNVPAGLRAELAGVLLADNDALRSALGAAAREKAELGRAVSRLERTLKRHLRGGCVLSVSRGVRPDRPAGRPDRTALQRSPRLAEPGRPAPAASGAAPCGGVRMEKLYLHYLRAESFRKALIYQKRYLLLLIGGFQDSEQETLSMIAHLGVFPSKAEGAARPVTRFRTAVRVVVAISRGVSDLPTLT